jgi:hypothetical protein
MADWVVVSRPGLRPAHWEERVVVLVFKWLSIYARTTSAQVRRRV